MTLKSQLDDPGSPVRRFFADLLLPDCTAARRHFRDVLADAQTVLPDTGKAPPPWDVLGHAISVRLLWEIRPSSDESIGGHSLAQATQGFRNVEVVAQLLATSARCPSDLDSRDAAAISWIVGVHDGPTDPGGTTTRCSRRCAVPTRSLSAVRLRACKTSRTSPPSACPSSRPTGNRGLQSLRCLRDRRPSAAPPPSGRSQPPPRLWHALWLVLSSTSPYHRLPTNHSPLCRRSVEIGDFRAAERPSPGSRKGPLMRRFALPRGGQRVEGYGVSHLAQLVEGPVPHRAS